MDGERVIFRGDDLPAAHRDAPLEDLGDRALVPAFCDSHIHFASHALFSAGLDIRGAGSIAECQDQLRDFVGLMHTVSGVGFPRDLDVVHALEASLEDHPREDHRHGFIHACLPTAAGLETCARLGIPPPVQPGFLDWSLAPLEYLEDILGPERVQPILPLRTMQDMGIRMSGGSDRPVPSPIPSRAWPRPATTSSRSSP